MTIREIIDYIKSILKSNEIDSPALTAGVLMSYVLKCDRSYLLAHDDEEVLPENEAFIFDCIKRLCLHEPLDYIIGERDFMGMTFKVGPGVLVPRPDTELLAEKCIEFGELFDDVKIIDLCTGSGCVAISVGKFLMERGKKCKVIGVDISDTALDYATKNADINGVSSIIHFEKGDVFNLDALIEKYNGLFTIISINPPYIPSDYIIKLDRKVKEFEPELALDGGEDGLDFYREIVMKADKLLADGGMLAFETGYDQCDTVRQIISDNGSLNEIKVSKDLAGVERVVTCRLK